MGGPHFCIYTGEGEDEELHQKNGFNDCKANGGIAGKNTSHFQHSTLNCLQAELMLCTTFTRMLSKIILLFFGLIFYMIVALILGGRN